MVDCRSVESFLCWLSLRCRLRILYTRPALSTVSIHAPTWISKEEGTLSLRLVLVHTGAGALFPRPMLECAGAGSLFFRLVQE
jgi:hypothetical protein